METTMRALSLSLVLAFTVLLSGVSIAGSSDSSVPHVGLFTMVITPNL